MKKLEEVDDNADSGEDNDDAEDRPKRRQVECIMGNHTAEELRNMHPQRNTLTFDWSHVKVTFSSDFDAGNMARCE